MAQKRHPRGTLPNLSLAEAHHKADKYSLSDLHRQSNAAAKQAILHELHSSMQLRAEKIRLHRKKSPDARDDGASRLKEPAGTGPQLPFGFGNTGTTKHVTFHEADLEPRVQSRIPVPVRPDHNQRSRGPQVIGGQDQGNRGRNRPNISAGGSGDRKYRQAASTTTYKYTWGQRGRLNELRIRFLAGKFFKIWKCNACTGVHPSVIRRHYNSRLLQKMFAEWQEFWWTQRREWTLMIRAEYHHRYKIYQRVWVSWRAFLVREKVKNAKKEISSMHASNKQLSKAMTAWKQYVTQRRAKAVLLYKAEKFHQRRALQFCWNEWKFAMQQRREEWEGEMYALQYWAESVTQKAWDAWKRRWRERQDMKEKENHAQSFYEKTLVARCYYKGLLPYTLHRQDRRRANGQAYQVYGERLLIHAWQHWNQRWFTRRSLAQRQEQVDHLGNRARMRRVLVNWRFYIHLVHVDRKKEDVAKTHRNTQLKKLGLLMLRLAVVQRRVKVRRTEQAIELHQQMLVKRSWNQWILQCEHREELRLFSATRKARQMHRKRLLLSVVEQWCHYTVWRRHRKEQYARADAYYARRNLLPKCIQILRNNAELEKRKRALQAQAVEFYREGQLGRFFYRWCHFFQTSQDIRMMERMAFLHHESILAKRFFAEWKKRTRSKLKESEKMYLAVDHHHVTLCSQALHRWMKFSAEVRQRSEFERIAVQHAYLQRVQMAWHIWREYVVLRRCKAVKKSRADFYHHRKQMRKVFTAWKQHCEKMRSVYQVVAVKEAAVNHTRLRCTFSDWVIYVESAKDERLHGRIAVQHWNTKILAKVIAAWHAYAHQHAANAAVKAWRLEQLQILLNKSKLKRSFLAWKQCSKTELEERRREMRADTFCCEKLRARCFQQWKTYRLLCIKKALMARQAMWMNKIRIQAKSFSKWKNQFGEAQVENSKTVMSLWLWSMRLQQRTLHAWISYVKERQRKKARITEALEQRRLELLREGVRQWLMVAGSLGERRASIAAKHHAQMSYKSYQVVQRCATLWRRKTIANKGKQRSRNLTHRRVRFEDEHPTTVQVSEVTVPCGGQGSKGIVPPTTMRTSIGLEPSGSRGLPIMSSSVDVRMYEREAEEMPFSVASKPVTGKMRPQPRRPDFLRDSLQREGLWSQTMSQVQSKTFDEDGSSPLQSARITPSLPSLSNIIPPNDKWTIPSNVSKPITSTQPIYKDVPPDNIGKTKSLEPEGLSTSSKMLNLESDSEGDDKDYEKRIPVWVTSSSRESKEKLVQREEKYQRIDVKPPVLLPPSAFSVGPSTSSRTAYQDKHASQPSSDRASMLPTHASHISSGADRMLRCCDDDEGQSEQDKGRAKPPEVLYADIQRLKNTLQGYQDMKTKLKRLRVQEAELHGWVKELNLPSSTEDSAALLIGDELTQVQEEITELSSQLHQRKPEIKNILSQITQLTQQTTS